MERLPKTAMQQYEVRLPLPTHWEEATCEDIDCPHWLHGWKTLVDEGNEFGQRQAHYIRKQSGRQFREQRTAEGLTAFIFQAFQKCFRRHIAQNGRPAIWQRKRTDRIVTLSRPEDWRDDMQEQLELLRQHQERSS